MAELKKKGKSTTGEVIYWKTTKQIRERFEALFKEQDKGMMGRALDRIVCELYDKEHPAS